MRYRQNHVDAAATTALSARVGQPMDGLTESYLVTIDEAVEMFTRDEVAVGAIDDEKRFIDHSRSQFGFYRTVLQLVPAADSRSGTGVRASRAGVARCPRRHATRTRLRGPLRSGLLPIPAAGVQRSAM